MLADIIPHIDALFKALSHVINLIGMLVILWGFVVAVFGFFQSRLMVVNKGMFFRRAGRVRAVLGTYILFGLEIMIAGDVIETFLKPDPEELIILGTLVVIRTIISYFLAKEVDDAKHDQDVPS